jgi:hypothetical protein
MEAITLLLGFVVGLLLVVAIWSFAAARRGSPDPDGGLGVSTEGMKICPKCRMGNLWTGRSCSACGSPLRG